MKAAARNDKRRGGLLRWAGSKRALLPRLQAATPERFTRYIEPFAGSACLFFAIRPKKAILGDINGDLINAYDTIRKHPVLVSRAVHAFPRTKREYYRVRDLDVRTLSEVDRAARFVYLNRFCFNGVYRVNREGRFNVPRGRNTGRVPEELEFRRASKALGCAELRVGDFESCIRDVKKDDFVYLDPPYATNSRPTHGEYGYGSFQDTDLGRLGACLDTIDCAGATFLLSYAYGHLDPGLLSKWCVMRLRVQRHVAGFSEHRHGVYEVLVSNRELV